jgi:uncharacterized protein
MESNRAAQPLRGKDRLVLMDGARGLALLGILLVNLRGMGTPSMAYGVHSIWSGPWAVGAEVVSAFLLDGAFWTLFALLFGAGFSVMMGDSGPRSRSIGLSAYYRRLFLIGGFGLLHVLLLWWGDILMIYALAGIALPLFRRRQVAGLLIWAAVFTFAPLGLYLMLLVAGQLAGAATMAEWAAEYESDTRAWMSFLVEHYRSSDFGVVAWARWQEFSYNLWYAFCFLPSALGVMLIGMALAKAERFRLDRAQDGFYRKLLLGALLPAVLGKLAYAAGFLAGDALDFWANAAFMCGAVIGGPAAGLLFLCALRAVYLSRAASWLREGLVLAGRMALTLYLMQSLIAGFIFYGYGLGLYAKVPPYLLWPLGLIVFAGQVAFARYWLARHRMGPLEYLLRRFTYFIGS